MSMSVRSTPHVNFRGQARAALEFYHLVFGGDIALATYAQIGAADDPSQADQIAFGRVTAPNGFDVMAYDVQPAKPFDPGRNAFYITLQASDEAEVRTGWAALSDGAEIVIPLAPAPFASLYGMLTDRFGVTWIVGMMS
jgi:PhnB protein